MFTVCRYCIFVARNTTNSNLSRIHIVRLVSEEEAELGIESILHAKLRCLTFHVRPVLKTTQCKVTHTNFLFQVMHFISSHRNFKEKWSHGINVNDLLGYRISMLLALASTMHDSVTYVCTAVRMQMNIFLCDWVRIVPLVLRYWKFVLSSHMSSLM